MSEEKKIITTVSLAKLVASPLNVRKTGTDDGVAELAASIEAHGLLQGLVVAPREDGKYDVVAGARRLAALRLLAREKRLPRGFAVPVVVREDQIEEISLAENVMRAPLHPADQFTAFKRLADAGLGVADIAARFGASERVVRQRLALGAVAPALMEIFRDGDMGLDQLQAFTICNDHQRQESVWRSLGWNRDGYTIRRALTKAQVSARDRRVRFVGLSAYEEAGGVISRDLFAAGDECWLEDSVLLDRLAREKLTIAAEALNGEGWLWIEPVIEMRHDHGYRRVYPEPVKLPPEDEARRLQATQKLNALYAAHPHDEVPDDIRQRMSDLDAEITLLTDRCYAYPAQIIARAGAFVSFGHDGGLMVTRGFIRPEDEPTAQPEDDEAAGPSSLPAERGGDDRLSADAEPNDAYHEAGHDDAVSEDGEGNPRLSDRLLADLTAHRTLGLRDRVAQAPEVAMLALIHSLVAQAFYDQARDPLSCLAIRLDMPSVGQHADAISENPAVRAIAERHERLARNLPRDPAELWDHLAALGEAARQELLAHVVALSVTVLRLPHDRRENALALGNRLAFQTGLAMREYWSPTPTAYLARVTKATILSAVREAAGGGRAEPLAKLPKTNLIEAAAHILADSDWLPAPLRTMPVAEADAPIVIAAAAE